MRQQDKEAERAYYDRYGTELEEGLSGALYERWLKAAGLLDAAPADILEAACGPGHFGYRLALRGHRVTGVDLSPTMVGIANAKAPSGFQAIAGDMEDPGILPPGRFDVVFFGQALHHFPDIHKVLENCHRWLRPGGRLIMVEPNGSNPVNALGKCIGRVLGLRPAMRKSIGTVNEVSLPVGRAVRALRRQGFIVDLEQMEAQFPSETGAEQVRALPWTLRVLGACREGLYTACLTLLPPRMGGIQFILGAHKPARIPVQPS